MDERRRQLLELGAELFARHTFDELSMARIAREAGISKALLYHYFPSKHAYFVAALEQAADEVRRRTEPDPSLPPDQALATSLELRDETSERILLGLGLEPSLSPQARAAVTGWLWFVDGVVLDWFEHRDLPREEIARLLLETLAGALKAARPEV